MFKSLIAALAVVSVGTSALLVDSISRAISPADSLVARQYADVQSIEELEEQLPEACKATCEPTYPNLQKCYDQDREGCLEVCQQDEWDAMIDCSNCALREGGREFTDREASLLRQAMGLIERACRERGSTTDFKPLEVPTGSSSGSPSGDTTIWPSSIPAPTGATNAAMAHSAGLGGVAGGLLLTWLAW